LSDARAAHDPGVRGYGSRRLRRRVRHDPRETRGRDYAGWYASAAPVALVVIDAEGARATDLEDNALDPAPLLADVPSLAAIWPSD
jgi:hypothetical protein